MSDWGNLGPLEGWAKWLTKFLEFMAILGAIIMVKILFF